MGLFSRREATATAAMIGLHRVCLAPNPPPHRRDVDMMLL
jgi:hypothetical protein